MKVLGISPDVWISSAALVDSGKVLTAVAEERLNRKKMSAAFPSLAIEYCMKDSGCSWDEIECVAAAWNPGPHISSASGRHIGPARWRGEYLATFPANLMNQMGNPNIDHIKEIIEFNNTQVELRFVNHHLAHAASAFYLSPFKTAAILTVDGRGENETCCWFTGNENGIDKIQSTLLPHSLGLFYSTITEYLGFSPHSDEWKVMALASYGSANNKYYPLLKNLISHLEDGRFELDLSYFSYYLFDKQSKLYNPKIVELLGSARQKNSILEQRHYDIACALQAVFEETVIHMLRYLSKITGESNLCLAGGAAMNSVFNGKLREVSNFSNIFVPSCPDDTGVSVGAALTIAHEQGRNKNKGNKSWKFPREVQRHNYWGPSYSDDEIRETLLKYKIAFTESSEVSKEVAQMLADGKLVGWFQGRSEFGQRALGNRSIIADPRFVETKDKVNAAVKYREGFRPFAPAILEEKSTEYFDIPVGITVPFMEAVYQVKEEKRDKLGAVVHNDGSGRLQTVDKNTNPKFYNLISAFEAITGIPIILNTSFNLNGEPIVCSPTDAIRTFYSCGLDILVLGNFILKK